MRYLLRYNTVNLFVQRNNNMKYFLSLENHQIDEAISIGSIYHETLNMWYVDSEEKIQAVNSRGWNMFSANLYAKKFYIAKTFHICEHCSQPTIVYAIVLNDRVQIDNELNLTNQLGNIFVAFHSFINWDLYRKVIIKYTHEGYRSGIYKYPNQIEERIIMNHCINCMSPLDEMKIMTDRFGLMALNKPSSVTMLEINEDIFLLSSELVWYPQFDNMKIVEVEEFTKDIIDYYSIVKNTKQSMTKDNTTQNNLKSILKKLTSYFSK